MYRRNRRQLIHTSEVPDITLPDVECGQTPTSTPGEECQDSPTTEAPSCPISPAGDVPVSVNPEVPLRRSGRARKPPDWITNYVPS